MEHAPLGVRDVVRVIMAGFGLGNLLRGLGKAATTSMPALVVLPLIMADGLAGVGGVIALVACACLALTAVGTVVSVTFDDPMSRLGEEMRTRNARRMRATMKGFVALPKNS